MLENIVGVLKFCGSVSSFAFLTSKEPISQAIADIKVLFNIICLFILFHIGLFLLLNIRTFRSCNFF